MWDRHIRTGVLWVLKQVCFTGWLNKFVYRWIFPVFSKGKKANFFVRIRSLAFFTLCSRCNVIVQVCDVGTQTCIQSKVIISYEKIAGNTSLFHYLQEKEQTTLSDWLSLTNTGNSILQHRTEENQHFTKAGCCQHGTLGSGRAKTKEYEWQRSSLSKAPLACVLFHFLVKVLFLL